MDDAPFLDDAWHRVAEVRCSLRPDIEVSRHRYRGRPWYVLHDPIAGRTHRVVPAVWHFLSRLDGRRSIDSVWRTVVEELGDDAPSQVEVIDMLGRLHTADLLRTDRVMPVQPIARRRSMLRRPIWLRNLANPLAIRVPLWDCDRFLTALLPIVRPLYGRLGWILWLVWVGPAAWLAWRHASTLTEGLSDRLLAPQGLMAAGAVFLVVKAIHELSHGFALKANGAPVHEMGLMFLVLAPVPYVEASAANALRSKWQRAFVGFAGMWAELAIAAGALYLWLLMEPGVVRATMHSVILVAGISTLLFNGNPLLKFDGYYILSDLLEIPNLAQRSNEYWLWMVRHYVLGDRRHPRPNATKGEVRWFLAYAPLALSYRLAIMVAIALFVAQEYMLFGALLAVIALVSALVLPLAKGVTWLIASPTLARERPRAIRRAAALLAFVGVLLFFVPVPVRVVTQGVVWVPPCGEVRALESGFVDRLLVANGSGVRAHQPILTLVNDDLEAERDRYAAKVDAARVRYLDELARDRTAAALALEGMAREQASLELIERRVGALFAAACQDGTLTIDRPEDLVGRFVERGDLLGFVLSNNLPTVRAVVEQKDIGLVRTAPVEVDVLLYDAMPKVTRGRVLREVPAGLHELPSTALGTLAAGAHAVDPSDGSGRRTLQRVFHLEVALVDGDIAGAMVGARALVKHRPPSEPLFSQAWRRVRQTLLSALDV